MQRLFSPGVSFHHDHPNVTRVVGCFGHTYPHCRCFLKPWTPTQATGALPYALGNRHLAGTLDTRNAFALPLLLSLIETNKMATDFRAIEEWGAAVCGSGIAQKKSMLTVAMQDEFRSPTRSQPPAEEGTTSDVASEDMTGFTSPGLAKKSGSSLACIAYRNHSIFSVKMGAAATPTNQRTDQLRTTLRVPSRVTVQSRRHV